jgi:hypothetical protein
MRCLYLHRIRTMRSYGTLLMFSRMVLPTIYPLRDRIHEPNNDIHLTGLNRPMTYRLGIEYMAQHHTALLTDSPNPFRGETLVTAETRRCLLRSVGTCRSYGIDKATSDKTRWLASIDAKLRQRRVPTERLMFWDPLMLRTLYPYGINT